MEGTWLVLQGGEKFPGIKRFCINGSSRHDFVAAWKLMAAELAERAGG
jgi:hypothetical protein